MIELEIEKETGKILLEIIAQKPKQQQEEEVMAIPSILVEREQIEVQEV